MAKSSLFHYVIIVSIANSVSPISAELLKTFPGLFPKTYNKPHKYMANQLDYDSPSYQEPLPLTYPQLSNRMFRTFGRNKVRCEISENEVVFQEDGYEFYPPQYVNKTCVPTVVDPFKSESSGVVKPEICLHDDEDSECTTYATDMIVLKKSDSGNRECWEYTTEVVAVGCKCNIHFKNNY